MTTTPKIRPYRLPSLKPWWKTVPFPLVSAVVFLAVTASLYGNAFLKGGNNICAPQTGDTVAISAPFMSYIGEQFRHGHFPLWLDRIYSGVPLVIQCNYFYPVAWLLAVLPVATMVNIMLAGHVFLAGWFMSFWSRSRGISGFSSIVAGLIVSLGAASTLQLFSGHDGVLTSIAWMPMIFMAIDKLFEKPRLSWALLGSFFVCMSVFGGLAQLTFYGAILAGIYTALRLVPMVWLAWIRPAPVPSGLPADPYEITARPDSASRRIITIALLALLIYPLAGLLSAADLMPTFDINQETLRSKGLDLQMAGSSSEPRGMFITLFDANFWGDIINWDDTHPAYFNRANFWEVNCYIGVGALVLAVYGAIRGRKEHRRFMAAMVLICAIGASGRYIPWLFRLLATCVPLYASFRATSRFFIPMTIFLALLAGAGLDALPRRRVSWWSVGAIAAAALLAVGVAMWLRHDVTSGGHAWADTLKAIEEKYDPTGGTDAVIGSERLEMPQFIRSSGLYAAGTLITCATLFAAAALIFAAARYWSRAGWLMGGMVAAEVFFFAWHYHTTTNMVRPLFPVWKDETALLRLDDPDARVATTTFGLGDPALDLANLGMLPDFNFDNVYGYDQIILRRYADFVESIQTDAFPSLRDNIKAGLSFVPPVYLEGIRDPKNPNVIVGLKHSNRLGYLRCRRVLVQYPGDNHQYAGLVLPIPDSVAHAMLVRQTQIFTDSDEDTRRDKILSAINDPTFDPRQTVILEQKPDPAPALSGEPGAPPVVHQIDPDHLEITADAPGPAVLVVTDSYAKGWKAVPMPDDISIQTHYDVLPADYTFRGIPLAAGHHHIMLEYAPASFTLGLSLSLGTFAAWLVALVLIGVTEMSRRRRLAMLDDESSEPVTVAVARVGGAAAVSDAGPLQPASEADRLADAARAEAAARQSKPAADLQPVAGPQSPVADQSDTENEIDAPAKDQVRADADAQAAQSDADERDDLDAFDLDDLLGESDVPPPTEIAPPPQPAAESPRHTARPAQPPAPAAESVAPPAQPPAPKSPPAAPAIPIARPIAPPAIPVATVQPPAAAVQSWIDPPQRPIATPAVRPPATTPVQKSPVVPPSSPPAAPKSPPPAAKRAASAPATQPAAPPPPRPAAATAKPAPSRPAASAPTRPPVSPTPPPRQRGPAKPSAEPWAAIPRFDGFGNADTRRTSTLPRKPQPPAAPPKSPAPGKPADQSGSAQPKPPQKPPAGPNSP